MDPFAKRMLDRAIARREKMNTKQLNSGVEIPERKASSTNPDIGHTPQRKPLSENTPIVTSHVKKLKEDAVISPQKPARRISQDKCDLNESNPGKNSPRRKPSDKISVFSPNKTVNSGSPLKKHTQEVTVTKFSPQSDRDSDVAVEINIMHGDDVQIEVQVEERDVPVRVCTPRKVKGGSSLEIKQIEELDNGPKDCHSESKSGLRQNVKSRLDRLGVLYSDKQNLSSPIQRTESKFTSATPPDPSVPKPQTTSKKKFGRLAALADEINNWEDDLTHHKAEQSVKPRDKQRGSPKKVQPIVEESTLDVSIHSYEDIPKVLGSNKGKLKVDSSTFTKTPSVNECQRLDKNIVASLEAKGYKRVSVTQSRLVYDFSNSKSLQQRAVNDTEEVQPTSSKKSNSFVFKMATAMVRSSPSNSSNFVKRPSIKKYRAPTPPKRLVNGSDKNASGDFPKDVQSNVVSKEPNDTTDCCIQTKNDEVPTSAKNSPLSNRGSPCFRRFLPRSNEGSDKSSVMSKAAMFEEGKQSPKRDPCTMSLRERKALFERNKGSAIVPKAPFGQAPSAKALQSERAESSRPARPILTSTTNSTSSTSISSSKSAVSHDLTDDSSAQGGIRNKVAALYTKERTISEASIAEKFRKERDQELQMLQNRFQHKDSKTDNKMVRPTRKGAEPTEDPESIPLMSSAQDKPEIVGKVPKVSFKDKDNEGKKGKDDDLVDDIIDDLLDSDSDDEKGDENDVNETETEVIGQQPTKRKGLHETALNSVLDDAKRSKANGTSDGTKSNGTVPSTKQSDRIYPSLSEVENSHEEECGGNRHNESDTANKSDNWGDTSLGREVLKVVTKNSYEYHIPRSDDQENDSSIDSAVNDVLEEALDNDSISSEGPTPPKQNKNQISITSRSFTFKQGSPQKGGKKEMGGGDFKSPLKPANTPSRPEQREKTQELMHSVSFYRRLQTASSTPSTPIRVVRRESPERNRCVDAEEEIRESTQGPVTVSQKIKELTAEISKQQTVISQASQALNLCAATVEFSGSTEQAEGERLLLLAIHRRMACLHELQRLQVEGAGPSASSPAASLLITDLVVPLRRDYIRQLNADGATGHHVMLLLKCHDCVVATSMRRTRLDKNVVQFPDQIRMDGLTSDFKVTIEVYLLTAGKEWMSHDLKYHINTKKQSSKGLLTPKNSKISSLKAAPRIESPGGPSAVRSPQFALHGYCIFALAQAQRNTFTLNKMPAASPLEGSVQAKIAVKVEAVPPPERQAFLTCFDDVAGLGHWHRRYAKLTKHTLAYWTYPDHVHKKLPIETVDLRTAACERVSRAPRSLCARPHTLLLETHLDSGIECPTESLLCRIDEDGHPIRRHLLSADTAQDAEMWLDALNKALEYARCLAHQD